MGCCTVRLAPAGNERPTVKVLAQENSGAVLPNNPMQTCGKNTVCADSGLTGNCCPTDAGIVLGCCGGSS